MTLIILINIRLPWDVAAMASFLAFTTLLCIWVPVHLCLSKADFVELREWIIWVKKQLMDDVKALRMEEEMMKVRQSNFKSQNRFYSYLAMVTSCLCWHQVFESPTLQNVAWASICLGCYVQHIMVGNGFIEVTPQRLQFLTCLLHFLLLILIVCTGAASSIFEFVAMQILQTSVRFLIVFFFGPMGFDSLPMSLFDCRHHCVSLHVRRVSRILGTSMLCAILHSGQQHWVLTFHGCFAARTHLCPFEHC